jgi:FkbM family methyltransferase
MFRPLTRRARQSASLRELKRRGAPITAIIDVGVQRKTAALLEVFPDSPHFLFEPVAEFAPDIARAYRGVRHRLFPLALSDEDGEGRLEIGRLTGGAVTHAWLSKKGAPVRTARLDTIAREFDVEGPYLLKIDVDGADAPARVVAGAAGVMGAVSCVVCELVAPRFTGLAAQIESFGFVLWDIVDCCHYDGVFYQCDAVFVRADIVSENPSLRPFDTASFDPRKWRGP